MFKVKVAYWCPKCRSKIVPPAMLKNINLQTASINIRCGKYKCTGFISIKPEKKAAAVTVATRVSGILS
jgi:hypothetical protein